MPASKLPKESEKKEMSVQSMVKKKKFCASRLFHAPKVQRESVKKKHCAIDGCRDGKDKKNTTSAFSLCATRQECALSFSFTFSFLAFICVLRLCAFPFLIGSSIVFS